MAHNAAGSAFATLQVLKWSCFDIFYNQTGLLHIKPHKGKNQCKLQKTIDQTTDLIPAGPPSLATYHLLGFFGG